MPRYNKYDEATKKRVVKRFLQGENWQVTARENEVQVQFSGRAWPLPFAVGSMTNIMTFPQKIKMRL